MDPNGIRKAQSTLRNEGNGLHGGQRFQQAMGSFKTVLAEEPHFVTTSRYAAVIEARIEDVNAVLNQMSQESFDVWVV